MFATTFAVVTALVLCLGSVPALNAAPIAITYTGTGTLTYVDNPATTNPARDIFNGTLVSPQFGNGTVNVPNDATNYATATGHANTGIFSFTAGTFSGAADSALNLMSGTAVITYTITSGTGAFSGAMGTIIEDAQFTSFGNFATNTPATVTITSATGSLTLTPEPATPFTLALGLLGCAYLRSVRPRRSVLQRN